MPPPSLTKQFGQALLDLLVELDAQCHTALQNRSVSEIEPHQRPLVEQFYHEWQDRVDLTLTTGPSTLNQGTCVGLKSFRARFFFPSTFWFFRNWNTLLAAYKRE